MPRWNESILKVHDRTAEPWSGLMGFHIDCPLSMVPEAAMVAYVQPSSPEHVFSGDGGIPATRSKYNPEGKYLGSEPNPDWPGYHSYTTAHLLFVDEAEAVKLLTEGVHYWVEP